MIRTHAPKLKDLTLVQQPAGEDRTACRKTTVKYPDGYTVSILEHGGVYGFLSFQYTFTKNCINLQNLTEDEVNYWLNVVFNYSTMRV